jgi:hypothetical protein
MQTNAAAVAEFFNDVCPFEGTGRKELNGAAASPSLLVCLRTINNTPLESLGKQRLIDTSSQETSDISRIACLLIRSMDKGSSTRTRIQAQKVAEMVTKLHVFGEMSLNDREDFINALSPFSVRRWGLKVYDLGRRVWSYFSGSIDDIREIGIIRAFNNLKQIITDSIRNETTPTHEEVYTRFISLQKTDENKGTKYNALMNSFAKDILEMSDKDLQEWAKASHSSDQ